MSTTAARKLAGGTSVPPQPAVMLVDDDPQIRATVRGILSDEGYAVIALADGHDALAAIEGGWRPSVILLDLTMPTMDGAAFMARLRSLTGLPHIPVYVFSAVAGAADKARRLGAEGLVPKPVQLTELLAVVEKHRASD